MDIINVIIQAIVQGLTEFLPVSSSGHLSVVQHIMGYTGETVPVLSIVLHLGTLAAVFAAFWRTIWEMIKEFFFTIRDIFTGRFSWKKMNANRRMMFMVIIATLILVPVYLFKDFFTARQGDGDIIFEGIAFLFTAEPRAPISWWMQVPRSLQCSPLRKKPLSGVNSMVL